MISRSASSAARDNILANMNIQPLLLTITVDTVKVGLFFGLYLTHGVKSLQVIFIRFYQMLICPFIVQMLFSGR